MFWNWETGVALAIVGILGSSAFLVMFFDFSPAMHGDPIAMVERE